MSNTESLRFKERLSISENNILSTNHLSGKMIGEVKIDGYDAFGNQIFSETSYNDIVLPGATFVLGEMFKPSQLKNYYMSSPNNYPKINGYDDENAGSSTTSDTTDTDTFKSAKIFGFVVGNGGEDGTSVIAPSYAVSDLVYKEGGCSYLPFRVIEGDAENVSMYELKRPLKGGANAYYIKKFDSEVKIGSEYSDGTEVSNINMINGSNGITPIVTYAEMVMKINEKEIREFFGSNLENCLINQIGLVAGIEQENGSHTNLRLVTTLNFKAKDLSNNANNIQFTYRVYCL